MARLLKTPFAVAFGVTAALTLGLLLLREARSPFPAVRQVSGDAGAAYIDARRDVAHGGDALASALVSGLDWLARHQYAEGMWSARSFAQMCEGRVCLGRGEDEHDLGVTALAVLAMLESGRVRPKYEDSARRALAWLARRQDEGGCFGPRVGKYMYGHAVATLAFARAYPVLGEALYKHHAARGIRFLEMARNPGWAWRYGIRDGDNDTSVTGWVGAALLAAASPEVDIPVDPRAPEGIYRWLDEVTGDRYYEVSYRRRGGGGASVRGVNDHYERNEGLTAVAVWLWGRSGNPRDGARARVGARRLCGDLPLWNSDATTVDFCAWFAGTRALAACGDPALWGPWSGRVRRLLVAHQRKFNEGCSHGSWDPVDKWGCEGGRVYATAMNLLTLGVADGARVPAPPPSTP